MVLEITKNGGKKIYIDLLEGTIEAGKVHQLSVCTGQTADGQKGRLLRGYGYASAAYC